MKKLTIIFLILAVVSSSCKKSFLDGLQNNPNTPSTGVFQPPNEILPATLTNLAVYSNSYGTTTSYEAQAAWLGYWNYSPGYSFNSTVQNYIMSNTNPQLWDNYYGILTNLNYIVQTTNGKPLYVNYNAIANVLEVICFANLVDLYNDIPFTQALQAQANFFPKYDSASVIYDSLVARLDNAISVINANLSNASAQLPQADDVLFGGNMGNWLAFANTVKLRLLIHESGVSSKAAYLASEAANTASSGYITTDALVNPGYTSSQPNPMYGGFGLSATGSINGEFTYIKANQAAIDFYYATNDSRVGYFYAINNVAPNNPLYFNVTLPINFNLSNTSGYSGDYTGSQSATAYGGSGIGSGIISSPNQGAVIMLAAEAYFLQAEATLYGWLPGGAAAAQSLYHNGITSSYVFLNVGGNAGTAAATAQAYYNQPNLSYVTFPLGAGTDSLLHIILEQKWAALNGCTVSEVYTDWRRTYNPSLLSGYPLVPPSSSASEPHMPFRYYYPLEEASSNAVSWQAAGGPSIDPFNSKIFWMP